MTTLTIGCVLLQAFTTNYVLADAHALQPYDTDPPCPYNQALSRIWPHTQPTIHWPPSHQPRTQQGRQLGAIDSPGDRSHLATGWRERVTLLPGQVDRSKAAIGPGQLHAQAVRPGQFGSFSYERFQFRRRPGLYQWRNCAIVVPLDPHDSVGCEAATSRDH
jgi:hypothetical protein